MTGLAARGRGRDRLRWSSLVVAAALSALLVGCRYERSICDESPGSGCSACLAECQDVTPRAACEQRCSEGRWTIGWPPQLP